MAELFTEEDVRRYARVLHDVQCRCSDDATPAVHPCAEYSDMARAVLAVLAEDGRLVGDDEDRVAWQRALLAAILAVSAEREDAAGGVHDGLTMALAAIQRLHDDAPGDAPSAPGSLRLNQPMVAWLRQCAADTSSDWAGAITIYPPEARDLIALIDSHEAAADGEAPR